MPTRSSGVGAVTAYFDSRGEADAAIRRLLALGLESGAISIVEHHGAAGAAPERPGQGGGLFGVLRDTFTPDAAGGAAPAEPPQRSGFLLTAEVDDARYQQVLDILGTHGSIERDERTDS
jgi:hypothetical protein